MSCELKSFIGKVPRHPADHSYTPPRILNSLLIYLTMRNNHNNKVAVDEMVRFVDGHLHMVQVLHDLLVQQQQQQHPQPIVPVCVSNLRAPSPTLQRCCTSIEQMIDLNIRIHILAMVTSLTIDYRPNVPSHCPSLRRPYYQSLALDKPVSWLGTFTVCGNGLMARRKCSSAPTTRFFDAGSLDTDQEAGSSGRVIQRAINGDRGIWHVAKISRMVDSLSLGWYHSRNRYDEDRLLAATSERHA